MASVVVRPAGARQETAWLLLLCALILLVSAAIVAWRVVPDESRQIEIWQLDARVDLNAAEQGVNADLQAAADEILWALEEGSTPTPEQLAADWIPPFIEDVASAERGGHHWQLHSLGDELAYIGLSEQTATAGHFLLRVEAPDAGHSHEGEAPTSVWIKRDGSAAASERLALNNMELSNLELSNNALIAAGWQQVVSHFDASVTRGTGGGS
ncbi:DUF6162 family protein [Marinobacterium lutimaris]|uniref:Uncharacterized protein n=1 Tax=Marinobacterium lutimaris TaxID=568106 RepID=A0A1H6DI15_9GAMM|nr:DUF6162 family protein [Marinobacterium lutimaris]SEG84851.1 hypothetical protein SAMN05444390_106192 [Marinobacterium lutimaris]